MHPPLHTLDIDKYVKWYYNLCIDIACLPYITHRRNRYASAIYHLRVRYEKNPANNQSLFLSNHFSEQEKRLNREIGDLKFYTDERLNNIYYLPTVEDWGSIKMFRETALQTDIETFTEELDKSPLPEIELIHLHLQRIETDYYPDWIEFVKRGHPIPQANNDAATFAIGLGFIDYAKYLHQRIQDLEPKPTPPILKMQDFEQNTVSGLNVDNIVWKGSAMELYTLFADLKETDLIENTHAEIARVICASFRTKGAQPFAFSNVQTKLNSKPRSKKRADFTAWG